MIAAAPKSRILFVEDDEVLREHLAEVLSDEYVVDTAGDGEQALLAILKAKPDLVVADIVMPGLDGIELLKALRSTPQTQTLPVLLISGRSQEEVRIQAFELGADEYLAKPYTARELRARIRSVLQTVALRREATRRETHSALLESITDAFYALDREWRFTYVNQRALDYFGKSRPELIGRNFWEAFPTVAGSAFAAQYEIAMRERRPVAFEGRSPVSQRWLDVHVYPTPQGVAINFRDITQRKTAEQDREAALLRERQANALIDELFASAPVGLAFLDRELRYRRINARLAEMNGIPAEAHIGKRPEDLLPDVQDLKIILQKWREILDHGEPWLGVEVQGETPAAPGHSRTWLENFFPVRVAGETIGLGVVVQEITERKAAERDLRESEDRYRAFVAHSSEGIWRYELDVPLDISLPIDEQIEHAYRHARLAELNDAMARMYGYERAADLIGAPLSKTLPYDDAAARAFLRSLGESRYSVVDAESAEPDRDGTIRNFENSIVPVIEDGKLLRLWGVQRDITARKQAEERLRESDRRKDEFLALLAHELRNPLAPVRNGIQIFKLRATSDPKLQATALMMERQMGHLVRLVDDLLDVSRITHGKLDLRMQQLSLTDVLTRAVEASRPMIEAKQHELTVDVRASGLSVRGDPDRLVQVFANLLTNSAKYTDRNGRIGLTLDSTSSEAIVTVTDNGIGIPENALEGVFEMFSQVDATRGRSGDGLGIGLALARRLLERHGGTIGAASAGYGAGSTFTVRLPLLQEQAVGHATSASPSMPPMVAAGRRALRVVVADDNEDAAHSLAMLLQMQGHQVRTAFDGHEAVALAGAFDPHVIFMDLGMPRMDGLQATQAIRATPKGRNVRIVAVTGWGQETDVRRTEAAGMDFHLTKPVSHESLEEALGRLS